MMGSWLTTRGDGLAVLAVPRGDRPARCGKQTLEGCTANVSRSGGGSWGIRENRGAVLAMEVAKMVLKMLDVAEVEERGRCRPVEKELVNTVEGWKMELPVGATVEPVDCGKIAGEDLG